MVAVAQRIEVEQPDVAAENRVWDFSGTSRDRVWPAGAQVADCDWENGLVGYDWRRGPSLDQSQQRIGDIEVLRASVRVNRVGHGPDIDGKVEAFIDFADAMSRFGSMPISPVTAPEELAIYILQVAGFPTTTGNAGELLVKYLKVMNEIPPLEAYVTIEYQIYLGERGWVASIFFGKEVWTEPILIENELVKSGLPYGYFGSTAEAINAALKRLAELQNEAVSNKFVGLRRYEE